MADDATPDIGAYLREARERAGVSLREVAAATKISVHSLEALERNDVARLPGGIFVRAFVRAYAGQVGLDPEDAVRRFVARFPDFGVEESPARYEANPERIGVEQGAGVNRLWRAVWWSLPIVLVVVYFGFGGRVTWRGQPDRPAASRPEQQAEPVPPGPETPILTTPVAVPPPEQAQALPAGTPIAAASPSAPASGGLPAQTPPTQSDDQQGAAVREGRFQITLAMRGLCWATVRANGVILFTGTMKAGERKDIDVWGRVSLTVGNAAVVDVAINGQKARPMGGESQVVTWVITADNLSTFLETR